MIVRTHAMGVAKRMPPAAELTDVFAVCLERSATTAATTTTTTATRAIDEHRLRSCV